MYCFILLDFSILWLNLIKLYTARTETQWTHFFLVICSQLLITWTYFNFPWTVLSVRPGSRWSSGVYSLANLQVYSCIFHWRKMGLGAPFISSSRCQQKGDTYFKSYWKHCWKFELWGVDCIYNREEATSLAGFYEVSILVELEFGYLASENEKLLAWQQNLLVLDDHKALFSSP